MDNIELLGTRVVNRRNEVEDAYIGRGGHLGLGNPFTHLPAATTKAIYQCVTREESIDKCEDWVLDQPAILAYADKLRGKRLGCYCHPLPCHGTIYVLLVATYVWMRESFGMEPMPWSPEGRKEIRTHYKLLRRMVEARLPLPACLLAKAA